MRGYAGARSPAWEIIACLAGLAVAACSVGPGEPSSEIDPARAPGGKADRAAEVLATDFGEPLAGLTTEELARFRAGQAEFSNEEGIEDGLGPVYNDVSCAACHSGPVAGGGSTRTVTRFGTMKDSVFDPMAYDGGSLIEVSGIGRIVTSQGRTCEYQGETVPKEATLIAHRMTTPLFGLGLVDAVPDETFLELAADQAIRSPYTAGRPNKVTDLATQKTVVGKLGWKGQNPSLLQFAADAYLNEMGITSELFPTENCPQGDCTLLACDPTPDPEDKDGDVAKFADFMTMLGPPSRGPASQEVAQGESVFNDIGCADCHVQTLRTGRSPIAALSEVAFHPYSDFLLHDMGSLGDSIWQGLATGTEIKTAPLWGLRARQQYLHDGRATTLDAAILAHEGQGHDSRDAFAGLAASQRDSLLAFLQSL